MGAAKKDSLDSRESGAGLSTIDDEDQEQRELSEMLEELEKPTTFATIASMPKPVPTKLAMNGGVEVNGDLTPDTTSSIDEYLVRTCGESPNQTPTICLLIVPHALEPLRIAIQDVDCLCSACTRGRSEHEQQLFQQQPSVDDGYHGYYNENDGDYPYYSGHPAAITVLRDAFYSLFSPTASSFRLGEQLYADIYLPAPIKWGRDGSGRCRRRSEGDESELADLVYGTNYRKCFTRSANNYLLVGGGGGGCYAAEE